MTKILALLMLVSVPAFADVTSTTCNIEQLDGYAAVSLDTSLDYRQAVTSTLVVGGEEIPALGESCFYENRNSTRGFRCVHELNGVRYQVYPQFKFDKGVIVESKIKNLGVIVDGATIQSTDCN